MSLSIMKKCMIRVPNDSRQSWGFHDCNRPIKGEINGVHLCGIHLRAAKLRMEADEKIKKEIEEQRRFTKKVERFAKKHGIKTIQSTIYGGKKFVRISFDELKALLED